ncbi:MAG: AEC family transporter [Verrucomicrobiota bacterium]
MTPILSTLVPVFLLIALGALLQRVRFFADGVVTGLNRLTYWIGLPTLVFVSLSTAEPGTGRPLGLLVVMLSGTVAVMLIAWGLSAWLGLRPADRGTFVQAGFRGNLAFVGLPVVMVLPDVPRTAAILLIAPMILVYNVFAVVVLSASRHGAGPGTLRTMVREILRNPIIWASAAGACWYVNGWGVWSPLLSGLTQLARMAVPLALLCIGTALVATPLRGGGVRVLAAAVTKGVLSPLVVWGLGGLAGVEAEGLRLLLVLAACPTAAVSFTMVRELGGDESLAARAIVASTLVSAMALTVIVALA